MTIKDMQRTYKKISKAFIAYETAREEYNTTLPVFYELIAERALQVAKSVKTLKKLCESIGRDIDDVDMHARGLGEDNFVRWCVLNNIEFVSNEEQTDETEEQTEEE